MNWCASWKNIFYFHIFSFYWFSNMILSDPLILPVSQRQTQQLVMMSLVSSHIEYLMQSYILLLILKSKLMYDLTVMLVLGLGLGLWG